MTWIWQDIVLFTGAVYGTAWLITQSKLTRNVREALSRTPFIGSLIHCIVCTATWVALGMSFVLPSTTLFSPGFRANTVLDTLVLMVWGLFSSWVLGRLLGDAYTEHSKEGSAER